MAGIYSGFRIVYPACGKSIDVRGCAQLEVKTVMNMFLLAE